MGNATSRIAPGNGEHYRVYSVMHHVNVETLAAEHKRQKIGKASGVDRVTKQEYDENLQENLENLICRMKSFSYRPQPVRRAYIQKEGGKGQRPLGIPSYEDKLVQGAMAIVLNNIYESLLYDFSYGFRQGKSQHQAVKAVNDIIMFHKVSYVVDCDIRGFFDNLDHEWLMKFLEHDIADKNFLRYIKRFLKSGVIEDLKFYESDRGTIQGGVISPVLANVYLRYVLDMWFDKVVKKQCRGEAYIVRYADDFICMFQYKDEAEEFYSSLKTRLAKFKLEIAEDKSKVIAFGRFARKDSKDGKVDTFDFLGFTRICGKTRNGKFSVVHRTSRKKMKAKKANAKEWLREHMHDHIKVLIPALNKKLTGHYNYYGVSGNSIGLWGFYEYVKRQLFKTLRRRGQKQRLTWEKFERILEFNPIAKPSIRVNIWATA